MKKITKTITSLNENLEHKKINRRNLIASIFGAVILGGRTKAKAETKDKESTKPPYGNDAYGG